jgi:hypothetical protein
LGNSVKVVNYTIRIPILSVRRQGRRDLADRAESSPTSVLLVHEAYGSVRSVAEWFVPRLPAPAKRHPIANLVG